MCNLDAEAEADLLAIFRTLDGLQERAESYLTLRTAEARDVFAA